MERMINYAARLSNFIAELEATQEHPFTMIDVGCSGGLHPIFERFGPAIVAHGFDPVIIECERLARAETRPHVHYHAIAVRSSGPPTCLSASRFHNGFGDTSAAAALETKLQGDIGRNLGPSGAVSTTTISLDDFMEQEGLSYLDFLKVDVDGTDLDVLRSGIRILAEGRIGVLAIEVTFTGSGENDDNTFHNVDRLLRQSGMDLANIEAWRYSLRELPAPFNFRAIGETEFGPPFQGDAVYFNAAAAASVYDPRHRAAALLRQAAILDLFHVPDCAAKLLLNHSWIAEWCGGSISPLLDALVPGGRLTYTQYICTFHKGTEAFFPKEDPSILLLPGYDTVSEFGLELLHLKEANVALEQSLRRMTEKADRVRVEASIAIQAAEASLKEANVALEQSLRRMTEEADHARVEASIAIQAAEASENEMRLRLEQTKADASQAIRASEASENEIRLRLEQAIAQASLAANRGKQAERYVQALLSSTSWKLTAPFRAISRFVLRRY